MNVRVLIAENDPELRGLFKSHVQTLPGFEVVGHARDETGAIDLCDELAPELILIGLDEGRSIDGALAEVRRSCPDIRVMVVASPGIDTGSIDGADAVLTRPMTTDTFSSALLELIEPTIR